MSKVKKKFVSSTLHSPYIQILHDTELKFFATLKNTTIQAKFCVPEIGFNSHNVCCSRYHFTLYYDYYFAMLCASVFSEKYRVKTSSAHRIGLNVPER